jgi:hypothetical protein
MLNNSLTLKTLRTNTNLRARNTNLRARNTNLRARTEDLQSGDELNSSDAENLAYSAASSNDYDSDEYEYVDNAPESDEEEYEYVYEDGEPVSEEDYEVYSETISSDEYDE